MLTPATIATGFAPAGFDGLEEADFERLLPHKPEVVLFGAGPVIRFPHPRLTRALTDARIGLEVMDTPGRVPHVQHPCGRRAKRHRRAARDVSIGAALSSGINGRRCPARGTPAA